MPKKHHIKLSDQQRQTLQEVTSRGTVKARVYKRAQVFLLADEAGPDGPLTDEQIATQVGLSVVSIHRLRRQFAETDLETALYDKPRSGAPVKFSGTDKAEITALACSEPPEGYARWSLRLLAQRLVELELVESISHKTVGQVLKKTR